jgi:hypothetical protein
MGKANVILNFSILFWFCVGGALAETYSGSKILLSNSQELVTELKKERDAKRFYVVENISGGNIIQCYQRGILVVDEKIEGNVMPQSIGNGLDIAIKNGGKLGIFPIGEGLCLIKTAGKVIQD